MASAASIKELGTLVVVVLKARNLPDKHTFTKQDPYAIVELGPCKEQTQADKRGGQHPVWDEDLRIKVLAAETKENRTMKVSCYAKEPKGDDFIGVGEVDVSDTLASGEFDDWVKLETNGAYRGEVYLEMTFFAAGPPPLARRASKLPPSERLWRPAQTPPKTSAHTSPYNTPPSHHAAELRASVPTSPKPSYLAPPRSSHSQSPTSRTDAPLPPIPDEIPASLLPAPNRASAAKSSSTNTSPKTDPRPIPAVLRPGGPARPSATSQQQHQQRPSSVPTSPTHAYQQVPPTGTAHPPVYGPHTIPNGYAPPLSQPVYKSQRNDYAPHPPVTPPSQPVYTSPQNNFGPYPSVSPYPSMSSYPVNPANEPPSLRYASSPPPATAIPGPGTMQFSFPEPSISGPSYPPVDYHPAYSVESEQERERRLSTRYGSPMPLPPGASAPPKPVHPHPATSPSPRPAARADPVPAPAPSTHVPDSYLAKERAALARAQQEEADAELARRLAAESEEASASQPSGGADADEEYARRLARELNSDVLKEARSRSKDGSGSGMPGGW